MTSIVSIITPSFNRADLVLETANSIMAQTYPFWEWVIVDDGSTDNSWEVLQNLSQQDNRIKIFQRDRNPKGACTCRNIAVARCSGDYVLFLDTDDLLAPFCLEQRVQALMENPEADFVIFPMYLFKKEKNDLNKLWNIDKETDDIHRMLVGDPICQGTGTLWKKRSFETVGMWREDLKIWQDIELHIRSFLWPLQYVKRMDLQPDVFLRVSDDSLSRGAFYSAPKVNSRLKVFTYSVKTIAEKRMIYSRNLKGIILLIKTLSNHHIINNDEKKTLIKFYFLHLFKLNKIKKFEYHFYDKISQFTAKLRETEKELILQ